MLTGQLRHGIFQDGAIMLGAEHAQQTGHRGLGSHLTLRSGHARAPLRTGGRAKGGIFTKLLGARAVSQIQLVNR